jgi:hypothetical protein
MNQEKTQEYCEKIASYLFNDGVRLFNYNIDEANTLIDKTCLPTALKKHLKENESIVLNLLKEYEN